MSGLSGMDIVRLIKSDKEALRELVASIASESELRLAVINAVLANVATKQDIRELRQEMQHQIQQLRQEINNLRQEMIQLRREVGSNLKWTIGTILVVWSATVIPILLRLAAII